MLVISFALFSMHSFMLIFFWIRNLYIHGTRKNNLKTRDKTQGCPFQQKLKNNDFSIVENHKKAVITKVSGVIRTSPRNCVLQHSPKRIKRIIVALKNSTIPFFSNAPQKGLGSRSPRDVSFQIITSNVERFQHPTINLTRKTKLQIQNSKQSVPSFSSK